MLAELSKEMGFVYKIREKDRIMYEQEKENDGNKKVGIPPKHCLHG